MKALFLSAGPERAASPRYRVHQYIPYLKANGVASVVCPPVPSELVGAPRKLYHLYELWSRIRQIAWVRHFNIVFVQKHLTSCAWKGLDRLLFAQGVPVVYDLDDAVYMGNGTRLGNPLARRFCCQDQIANLARGSRCVLAGNRHLARWARSLCGRVEVLPTAVDTERFRRSTAPPDQPPFTIAWVGSPSTNPYLNLVSEPLLRLARRWPVRVRISSANLTGIAADVLASTEVDFVPWHLDTEVDDLAPAHVGIMPLPDDEWSRGKCALKALLYMAMEIPPVCSPVGVNAEVVSDGENGFLASTSDEWVDRIGRLLADGGLRERLGIAARRTVEERYSVAAVAPRLLHVLRECARC